MITQGTQRRMFTFFVLFMLSAQPLMPIASEESLGSLEFPTSGPAEATPDFILGVLYLHSFEYDLAADAFQRAQAISPDFAMAYWGEAMTFHHSLWARHFQEKGQAVLKRLGNSSELRAAKASTEREKDYLEAVEILYGMTEESINLNTFERTVYYRDVMKRIHLEYPDDFEARAFYGLAILGVGSANRDYATYIRAAAILTPVWDANRSHPGGAHYLIHSYDDPVHAILGLPMARAYGKYAVGAAHAQHMTSHIYVALGLWDDMIAANVTALRVESAKKVGEGARSREAWHHRYWLAYGRLQQGHLKDAKSLLKEARDYLDNNPLEREPSYYGAMYARFLIDTELWHEADNWLASAQVDVPAPHYYFAQAYAAIKRGEPDKARQLMRNIRPGGLGNPEIILNARETDILNLELSSLLALAEGDATKAVDYAREAVSEQTSMPFRYGPPRISKPSAELLGDILMELGRWEEALIAYRDQLSRSQLRTNSLLGLARAAAKSGDESTSREAYLTLAEIWHDADADLLPLAEVRKMSSEKQRK